MTSSEFLGFNWPKPVNNSSLCKTVSFQYRVKWFLPLLAKEVELRNVCSFKSLQMACSDALPVSYKELCVNPF